MHYVFYLALKDREKENAYNIIFRNQAGNIPDGGAAGAAEEAVELLLQQRQDTRQKRTEYSMLH